MAKQQPSASASVRQAIVDHKSVFRPGHKPIALFPEGTATNGRALLRFFSGAFEGGGAVQPILLTYSFHYFNAAAFLTSPPAHICRALLTPWQHVCIEFLPLYVPSEAEAVDPELYAENVRQALAKAGDLALSTYDARML